MLNEGALLLSWKNVSPYVIGQDEVLMTRTTANALYRYFEALYLLNQNLIILCGMDATEHMENQEKYADEVMMAIPRLIPYMFNKATSSYIISQNDGLMKFAGEIPFLREDYERILDNYKVFLENVKKVRNKLEHEMHGAIIVTAIGGGAEMFAITYKVSDSGIGFEAAELISFVKELNVLFSKIQIIFEQFACEHKLDDHPYYSRLIRYRFSEFNKIYESNLLYTFGKALLPF